MGSFELPSGVTSYVFAKQKRVKKKGKQVEYVKEYTYPNTDLEYQHFEENGKQFWWSPFGLKVEQGEQEC